ncbi:MAG: protein phosphatase CheZ, partial [Gammaproteobacteria bacterium]|nr:protein phosphatase CheZ [Gammaproteobacteria bacterium]
MNSAQPEIPPEEVCSGEYLTRAQALVDALKTGSSNEVARLVDELTSLRETQIYQRIGRLTRELHDSIATFCEDTRVSAIAHEEMPNARERLQHVITLTQDSADKTLTAVEECIPLAHGIGARAQILSERWIEFRERRLTVEEFRALSAELEKFLASTRNDADRLHAGLSDVLMAQEFQDLTGQMIQRVISLVGE